MKALYYLEKIGKRSLAGLHNLTHFFSSDKNVALVFLSAIIWIASIGFFYHFQDQFIQLNQPSKEKLRKVDREDLHLFKEHSNELLSVEEVDILWRKSIIHKTHKERYLNLLEILYKNNYALLTLIPFFTGLTALLAFSIVRSGWTTASPYLRTLFINFAFLSGLSNIYTEVYQQPENIQRFTEKFIAHSQFQKTFMTLL